MKTDAASDDDKTYYLPDFCTSRAALAIVLIVELTAFVLALASCEPRARVLARSRAPVAVPDLDRPRRRRRSCAGAASGSCDAERRAGVRRRARHHRHARRARLGARVAAPARREFAQRLRHLAAVSRRTSGGFALRNVAIGLVDHGAGAALLLRGARVAAERRDAGARARACAAGAHPAALPVQQHEHHRLAHAHRTRRWPSRRCRTWRTCSART